MEAKRIEAKNMLSLEDGLRQIEYPSKGAEQEARERWDSIAHPLHSLGTLEDVVVKIAGITHHSNVTSPKKALIIMCADNGVVEEGVTQTGQEVTAIVAENFLTERATAAILCKQTKTDIYPVDIGIARDTNIICKKISYGTKNMVKEPAMTREDTIKAIEVGISMVAWLKEQGYGLIATGEMGIGNTTTSSAIVSVLLQKPVKEVTGKGAGLTKEGLIKKVQVIEKAIALHSPNPLDGIDVLSKVGGLDLAGLAGVFIGGAIYKIPVVVDGFISGAAALAAAAITPAAKEVMIASHISKEPAAKMVLDALGLEPSLCCGMCLGEGTGAVAFLPLIDLGISVYQGMSTFLDNEIEQYEELG